MQKRIFVCLLGVLFLTVCNHGQPLVIDGVDDADDDSVSASSGESLVHRVDLNKLFQRWKASSFTQAQRQYQHSALEAHNRHRARHCVSPLQLDDSISRSAQNYAQHLANINQMVHSNTKGLGENLAKQWSSAPIQTINGKCRLLSNEHLLSLQIDAIGEHATDSWYKEIKLYNFNWPGFSMSTGHFTQVVWKGSQKLGVGFAVTTDGKTLYVMAQYSSPGNYRGQFEHNVLPARRWTGIDNIQRKHCFIHLSFWINRACPQHKPLPE